MKTYRKNILRTIQSTRGRFLAIFAIVALGVGFLAGLLSTTPDIGDSMERYLDAAHFYDFKIVSTLGLTEQDVAALRALPGVGVLQASYSADVLLERQGGETEVARLHSLPADAAGDPAGPDALNRPALTEGRWPAADDECVVEEGGSLHGSQPRVGETITVSPDNEKIGEKLDRTSFRVVGKVRNPYYFSYEREPASVGSGSVAVVFYLRPGAFAYTAYTEIYGSVTGAAPLDSLSAAYRQKVAAVTEAAEGIADARCAARYDEVTSDARQKIDDARQEYEDAKAEAEQKLSDAAQALADGRQALQEGRDKLAESEQALADGRREVADNEQTLAEGQTALEDAMVRLRDGQAAWEAGAARLAEGETQLAAGKAQLEEGQRQYDAGLAQYQQNAAAVQAADDRLAASKAELDAGRAAWDGAAATMETARAAQSAGETAYAGLLGLHQAQEGLDAGIAGIRQTAAAQGVTLTREQAMAAFSDAALAAMTAATPESAMTPDEQQQYRRMAALNGAQKQLDAGVAALMERQAAASAPVTEEQARAMFTAEALSALRARLDDGAARLAAGEQTLAANKAALDDGLAAWQQGQAQLADAHARLDAAAAQLAGAKTSLDGGWAAYNTQAEALYGGKAALAENKKTLDSGWAALTDKQSQLADAQGRLADAGRQLDEAAQELADGRATIAEKAQELADGETDYAAAKAEADARLADGKARIDDAQRQLDELEKPTWYVWDRDANVSFHSFRGNVTKVAALASVFPVFFFAVAALVVLTTMTRMVEEERQQIGTMKALGYQKGTIAQKYLWYALAAALSGAAAGLAAGFTVFPAVIWNAYATIYYLPRFYAPWRWNYALLSGGSLVACALLATWGACRATLHETPAALMRPRAPKAGKRILLESIRPLWRRLTFTQKVTCRNLLRYKKRFWMTVVGVAGCTALLVTGFGISDSINGIITKQYSEISLYDLMTTVRKPEDAAAGDAYAALFENPAVQSSLAVTMEKVNEPLPDGGTAEVYLMAPQDPAALPAYLDLRQRVGHKPVPLAQSGVVLSEKLASLLGARAGDTVTLLNAEKQSGRFVVSGVCENYIANYIYLSPAEYARGFGASPRPNAILSVLAGDTAAARDALSARLLANREVSSVTFTTDMVGTVLNLLTSIHAVVVMIVVCAAGLALVVLYNLTNINIAERVKEIATIKVLGFYDREVSAYVMRENVALSVIGALLGLALGVALHRYIVVTVEVDAMMFGRDIRPVSFVYALALTMLFSTVVNAFMGRKLRHISMVESMKAPE